MTELHHHEDSARGSFELSKEGEVLARMTYSRIDANNIIIDHTATNPAAKGTGAGKQIVMEMEEWARQHSQKVLPLCPFAKAILERNPETHDILRE